ncbi:MAG: long-chain-fatty-acid--CoA ligase [Planctomycetaceae bacterium]|nr:long-chain-fatty-acid--CoA ligase [Planctomycetaceae bacterium]
MTLNLGGLLANSAGKHPQAIALIENSRYFRYAEIDIRARRLAGALHELNVGTGQHVALLSPNCSAFTISYYGILYAGATVVSLNTLQTADELAFQLTNSEATTLIVHGDCQATGLTAFKRVPTCRHLISIDFGDCDTTRPDAIPFEQLVAEATEAEVFPTMPDDTAVIQYTSGTTGIPKGAELSHFNLYYNAQYVSERSFSLWPDQINILGPGHVGLAALPLYHTFGQTNIQNGMLFGGGAVTYLKRFSSAEAMHVIERDRVTFFPAVPTMYFALLHDDANSKTNLSSLQFCVSGGAPIPIEIKRQFEARFNVAIQEGYGLTETSPLAAMQKVNETTKAGTIGKPIDGVEFRIVDDQGHTVPNGERGELLIRGPNVMKGYFKQPQATGEVLTNGWFHSGDIASLDSEGDISIVDRKKDMILRGGYNVYPREIEEVLYTHPAIKEAAVIGVLDDRYGEEVKAIVSLKPDHQVVPDELVNFCKQYVAAYKYPRIVEIRDELPKGPTGKLLKRSLRSSHEQ